MVINTSLWAKKVAQWLSTCLEPCEALGSSLHTTKHQLIRHTAHAGLEVTRATDPKGHVAVGGGELTPHGFTDHITQATCYLGHFAQGSQRTEGDRSERWRQVSR